MQSSIGPAGQQGIQQVGFLDEGPGNRSSMRLMCMMSLVTAIVLSSLLVVQSLNQDRNDPRPHQSTDPQILYIIYGFLIAAFAPKAVQKFAEQKLPAYDPTLAYRQGGQAYGQQPYVPQPYAGYLPPASANTPGAGLTSQTPNTISGTPGPLTAVQGGVVGTQGQAPPTTPSTAMQTVLQRGVL